MTGNVRDVRQAAVLRLDALLDQAGKRQRLAGVHFDAGVDLRAPSAPARRTQLTVTLRLSSISLSRGRTSRRMRPLPSTIGTKSTCVPKSLYSIGRLPEARRHEDRQFAADE